MHSKIDDEFNHLLRDKTIMIEETVEDKLTQLDSETDEDYNVIFKANNIEIDAITLKQST